MLRWSDVKKRRELEKNAESREEGNEDSRDAKKNKDVKGVGKRRE